MQPENYNTNVSNTYRDDFPSGKIGEPAGLDPMHPDPQKVETVAYSPLETRPQREHMHRENPSFNSYKTFNPQRAAMPRAAQDQVYLEGYGKNCADPCMTDEDGKEGLQRTDEPDRKELFGNDRDGVTHNQNHPGFKAVQSKIEGEGYSARAAGAILASKTRGASKAAHKANPRLNRVKG